MVSDEWVPQGRSRVDVLSEPGCTVRRVRTGVRTTALAGVTSTPTPVKAPVQCRSSRRRVHQHRGGRRHSQRRGRVRGRAGRTKELARARKGETCGGTTIPWTCAEVRWPEQEER